VARKKSGNGENMSQAIRDYLTEKPESSAKEVIAGLAQKGVTVKPNLVYFIKGKLGATKQRRKKVARAAKAAASTGSNGKTMHADALTLIKEIKALAQKSGGIGKLKALVEALAE
jgi:hypothetical protein